MDILKYIKNTFIVLIVAAMIFFVYGQVMLPKEKEILKFQCDEFQGNWEYISETGERIAVEIPGKVEAEAGEEVRIVTTLPDEIDENEVLAFRTVWQDAKIYVGNELRTEYSTRESRAFGRNSAFRYVFVELEKEDAGQELMYCLTTETKYSGTIRNIYTGDKIGVMMHLITESGTKSILAAFLLMLSLFCLTVCLFLRVVYKKHLTITYLVTAMLLSSAWMISELEFRQIIFNNISTVASLTFICLMLIPISFVLYINEIQKERYKKLFSVPLVYFLAIFLLSIVLQVLNVVDLSQMLPFFHGGMVVASVCIIATIGNDIRNKRIKEYSYVGIGILGLVVSAFIEIVLYYMSFSASIGSVLVIGLMFFLVTAIVKTGQDLMETEKKKQEAILARDAQSKFLASMSHEIRTPINAVIGMNEMILRESKDAGISQYAEGVKRASNMLLGLVNDILDFSKIESGNVDIINQEYDVLELIEDEKLLLNARASEKKISIETAIDRSLPSKLYGDELHIKQVVGNLISNAVKYTMEGSISFKVYHKTIDENTVELYFSVKDTGIGIKPEHKAELFDSFKRLEIEKNRSIQGTGLGLSIAKQLAELMDGELSVESEYGKGSEFILRVKQKVADITPIGKTEESSSKNVDKVVFTAEDASVLVVDDNEMNLAVIRHLLKKSLVKTDTALSGREGIEKTKRNRYDIILLDHMMPELDGVATLKMIRDDSNNVNQNGVIIVLTANAVSGCREMYLNYGFNDYFTKPIEPDKLDELLLSYLPPQMINRKNEKK